MLPGTDTGVALMYIQTHTVQKVVPFFERSLNHRVPRRRSAMKKATHADAVLISRSMNMKIDVVWDIIGGMNYSSYSELVMAVLICLKPLPLERFTSSGQ
jgi:hypothetical protein